MRLKVKSLKLAAGRPVAILHAETAKKLAIYVNERVKINKITNKKGSIIAIVDTAKGILKENEIALSAEVFEYLKLKENEAVEVYAAGRPKSTYYISEKLNGKELDYARLYLIIKDIVENALTESEIAYFISGIYVHGMTLKETAALTTAIVQTGKKLDIDKAKIVDKHSSGGTAGNRTTPIIVSICASAGLVMPKTSSRAITSAAGTADTIECISDVEFTTKEMKEIVNKTNGCMVWGGSLGLAPADDKIIQVERILSLDPEAQLLASILAKKLSVNAHYVLIDIPCGNTAKLSVQGAKELEKKFQYLGNFFGLKLKTILTDGSQPIGNGIGPVLEMRDVLAVLRREKNRPMDLEKKSLLLSGILLEMTGKAKKGEGNKLASEILNSKEAYKKFEQIIKAQKGSLEPKVLEKKLMLAEKKVKIRALKAGKIKVINNKKISAIARAAGCPSDKSAGIYLYKHVGDVVKKGDVIMEIYSKTSYKLSDAKKLCGQICPIAIG